MRRRRRPVRSAPTGSEGCRRACWLAALARDAAGGHRRPRPPIDRELDDLIPKELADEDDGSPPTRDRPGKLFLYARYNALLTDEGLDRLGLGALDAASMRKMDAVDNAEDLTAMGVAVGKQVRLDHLGPFVRGA